MIYKLIPIYILIACFSFLNAGGHIDSEVVDKAAFSQARELLNDENTSEDEFGDEFNEEKVETPDPLEAYNRLMTTFNDKVYLYALQPISKGYVKVFPEPARIGVSNFIDNLQFPVYFVNNLLQLKLDRSISELARFVLNSTIGVFGFVDVASEMGIRPSHEDFGQTLGYWGVSSGFHIVLPFLGPSNLRDTLGLGIDWMSSPLAYTGRSYQIPKNTLEGVSIKAAEMVNSVSLHLGEYESLKKDTLDWYLFLRDSYEEQRKKEIDEKDHKFSHIFGGFDQCIICGQRE